MRSRSGPRWNTLRGPAAIRSRVTSPEVTIRVPSIFGHADATVSCATISAMGRGALVISTTTAPFARALDKAEADSGNGVTPLCRTPQTSHSSARVARCNVFQRADDRRQLGHAWSKFLIAAHSDRAAPDVRPLTEAVHCVTSFRLTAAARREKGRAVAVRRARRPPLRRAGALRMFRLAVAGAGIVALVSVAAYVPWSLPAPYRPRDRSHASVSASRSSSRSSPQPPHSERRTMSPGSDATSSCSPARSTSR